MIFLFLLNSFTLLNSILPISFAKLPVKDRHDGFPSKTTSLLRISIQFPNLQPSPSGCIHVCPWTVFDPSTLVIFSQRPSQNNSSEFQTSKLKKEKKESEVSQNPSAAPSREHKTCAHSARLPLMCWLLESFCEVSDSAGSSSSRRSQKRPLCRQPLGFMLMRQMEGIT